MDEKEDKKIVKDRGKVKILKDPSRTRLCFCLHTGNCGENRTPGRSRADLSKLFTWRIERMRKGKALRIIRTNLVRSALNMNVQRFKICLKRGTDDTRGRSGEL